MGVGRVLISLVLCLIVSTALIAQEKPDVHKINGKRYYLHVVAPGNTLYGISRLYEVPIDRIEAENAEALSDGLKVNQTLLVPVTSENKRELAPVEQQPGQLKHQVQKGETLFSIAQQYQIPLEALLEANPVEAKDGLKSDSEIIIPIDKVEVKKEKTAVATPDSLFGHLVQKGETVFSITRMYGVTESQLLKANPSIKNGLQMGTVVRIPGKLVVQDMAPPSHQVDQSKQNPRDTLVDTTRSLYIPDSSGAYVIGMMLPLSAVLPDTIEQNFSIDPAARAALNFYRGFKLGIDSMAQKHGVSITVRPYDVRNDSYSLATAMADTNFDSVDVMVGPLYTQQFEKVADHFKARGVPVICPINKPSKILFRRANAMKSVPSESMQINSLAEYVVANMADSNLYVVNSNKFRDVDNLEFFKNRIAELKNIPDTFVNDAIKEIKLWDITNEAIEMRFKDSGDYVLIVPSTDQVFVTKLITGLYDFCLDHEGSYRFRVYGLGEWQSWEQGFDVKHLQKLQVTLPMPSHIDHGNYKIHQFTTTYFRKNGYEPDAYTMSGFDLASYFCQSLATAAEDWFVSPESYPFDGVLESYYFKRPMEQSGIENQFVRFYQYKDYRLKPVDQWPSTKK